MAKIWVIDDDQDVPLVLKFALEKLGHAVDFFVDGNEALERLPAAPPDLLIVDVMMPKLGGYTICTRLQENPNTRSLPVIIVTAKKKMRDLFEGMSNVSGFLEKPLDLPQVKALVEKALKSAA